MRRTVLSLLGMTAIAFSASVCGATAEDAEKPRGEHIPHTAVWVELAPASKYFDPDSRYGDVYGDEEAVFITHVEGAPLPETVGDQAYTPKVGDLIEWAEVSDIYDVEKLMKNMKRAHKYQDKATLNVIRGERRLMVIVDFD
ncbi:hypothetical protein SAMN06297251_10851 [Fulvimarina manganoxydans]|uniref:HIRAN domain-containing protein n=1 Tax=Fulvimarina manganoxydans TaxID=937218 RepID=A0A1W2BZ71_9HYPH|nr:hypothetical protein [Fulvimarina manganoxydans]SMC78200.1 hypothetical protein SAMN06297251_10851 [Fulvimarina manganoxydans]